MLQAEAAVLTVVCWQWGSLYGPEYTNRLARAVKRNLRRPFEFVCVADDPAGIDCGVTPPPPDFAAAPNCIRRLKMYDRAFARRIGERILMLDVDVVVTGSLDAMVDRGEPLVLWRVPYRAYNRIYAGGVVLMDAGVLHDMWLRFLADPLAYGTAAVRHTYGCDRDGGRPNGKGVRIDNGGWGIISDQAVLNYYAHQCAPFEPGEWTSGVAPYRPASQPPPLAASIVTVGREHKAALDEGRHQWIREHWR